MGLRMPSKSKPKKTAGNLPGASQAQVAQHLDISQPRVAQFVGEGIFRPLPSGKLDLDACRIAYIRWLRDESRKSTQAAAAARVQDARAKAIELRTDREAGKLIPVDDLEIWMTETLGIFRSALWGLPAASTRDLTLRAEIQKHLDDALGRIEHEFKAARDRCNQGRPAVLTEDLE
jgi:phage terminase Nu1 subunit (DNA packaging protein)